MAEQISHSLKWERENFMCLYLRSVLLRAGFCFCYAVALIMFASSGAAQGLASSDLSRLRSVGGVELSPDGRRIAYTVVMRDRPGRPYGQLWVIEIGRASCRERVAISVGDARCEETR